MHSPNLFKNQRTAKHVHLLFRFYLHWVQRKKNFCWVWGNLSLPAKSEHITYKDHSLLMSTQKYLCHFFKNRKICRAVLPQYLSYFQDSLLAFVPVDYADLSQILILSQVLLYILLLLSTLHPKNRCVPAQSLKEAIKYATNFLSLLQKKLWDHKGCSLHCFHF